MAFLYSVGASALRGHLIVNAVLILLTENAHFYDQM
jgi:hypothetical protein